MVYVSTWYLHRPAFWRRPRYTCAQYTTMELWDSRNSVPPIAYHYDGTTETMSRVPVRNRNSIMVHEYGVQFGWWENSLVHDNVFDVGFHDYDNSEVTFI